MMNFRKLDYIWLIRKIKTMIGNAKFNFYFKTFFRGHQETYTPGTYGLNKKALQIISKIFRDNHEEVSLHGGRLGKWWRK